MKENILRWILFLPVTIVITKIVTWLLHHVNVFSIEMMGSTTSSILYKLTDSITLGAVQGGLFVYVGSYIVLARYKKYVSILLAILTNFITIWSYITIFNSDNTTVNKVILFVFVLTVFISSILTIGMVNEDEKS